MRSDSPVAVVTGGTGGIGAAICKALAAAGFVVVVGFRRSKTAAEQLVAALPGAGHAALSAPVTDTDALRGMARAVGERYESSDVLVNCAGAPRFLAPAHLEGLDDALIDEILATQLRRTFAAV